MFAYVQASVSIQAFVCICMLHCILYTVHACIRIECISVQVRGDFKAKTRLEDQIHLSNMAGVMIWQHWRPWGENKHLAMMEKNQISQATAWLKCIYACTHSLTLLFIRLHHIISGRVWQSRQSSHVATQLFSHEN